MSRFAALLPLLLSLPACGTETPTEAVVVNGYALPSGSGQVSNEITVYRVWYATTLFRDPLGPGSTSDPIRTVPGRATAYAVLAPGWDPSSSDAPAAFVPVISNHALSVARGDTIQLVVSDRTFTGRCGGTPALDADEADFITQRIFPGEFEGLTYDPATCTSRPSGTVDAGASGRGLDAATLGDL
jgi:hypothetical protein